MIHFIAPRWLYFLFLLPLLILAHLLYHRRRRLIVSSLLIWQKSSDRSRRSLAFRRLLNINLLLQSLTLIAAVLALSRPEVLREDRRDEETVVLLLDRSAGMAVREEDGSRIEILRRRVSDLLSQMDFRRETAVFVFAARPELIGRFTAGDRELRTFLSNLEPTEEASNLPSALTLVREIYPAGETHIFTDGAWDGRSVSLDRQRERLHILGTPHGNVGFVHASVTEQGSDLEFYSLIGSYGLPRRDVVVTLSSDDNTVREETLTLEEETTTELLLSIANGTDGMDPGETADGGGFVLELTSSGDSLEADNRAYLVPAQRRPLRIARAGEANPFLDSVLSVYPESETDHYRRYSPAVAADIIVLDGQKGVAVPEGRVLALDSTIAGVHPAVPRYLPEGTHLEAATNHPVVDGIDISTVFFERVFTVPPRDGLRPLLYHSDSYAGFTFETERLKVVSLNFDTTRTNLVLQNAFPLLIFRSISWLSGDISRNETVHTGDTIHINTMPGDPVRVTDPRGETWSVTASGTSTEYSGTEHAGFYKVVRNDRIHTIAVNIFNREETDTSPRVQAPPAADTSPPTRPLWRLLTAAAMILLIVDTLLWSRKR